ncbi:hypothetical protein JM946_17185 [Steroidobacter sp. S1-65]|uniref:Uncharacterized protein n=1 Tax=Steroidobacter gossypii TaxID=2805490 RepID=A0ABS1WZQ8_9GAMM|nr:hypothetical protein [Steroidobacter gossypii]MBM0106465.1 hypothetical protein [Steroidobacter gossypii]
MPPEHQFAPLYRATVGREVFDEPLEWRVEDASGALICTVYDGGMAARIATALNLAEKAAAGAGLPEMADALERYLAARHRQASSRSP